MAERSDASPTGDPHIAQAEEAEMDAQRAAKAARLFVILGLGESDKSIAKSADINVNLYAGLGMLVVAAFFIAWGLMRPLSGEPDEPSEGDRTVKGAPAPVGADAAAIAGSKTTRRPPRSDRG